MIDTIKKARAAIEICEMKPSKACAECPYRETEWDGAWEEEDGYSCYDEMASDAAMLLGIMESDSMNEARLLTYREIERAPEGTLLFEEVRVDWGSDEESPNGQRIETEIAPMEKQGQKLIGSGLNVVIEPGMFVDGDSAVLFRYWLGRPSEEQRAETPWEGITP